jgi:dihydrofolate reductase
MNVSIDGFVEGPDGRIDWTRPDEEVHRFHNNMARDLGTFVYGRRMYETMAVWESMDADPAAPEFVREFARIWKNKPKVVFSTTLNSVGTGFRLLRGGIVEEMMALKQQPGGDIGVSGPGLASSLARLDLIDEFQLVVYPVIVGGGKSYFPKLDHESHMQLIETRKFSGGAVYLRYKLHGQETSK